jgi:hypothetical protein
MTKSTKNKKINVKNFTDENLNNFISEQMQKEPDKRHPQTFEAITEQGKRDPKTKEVFEGIDSFFKSFGLDFSKIK